MTAVVQPREQAFEEELHICTEGSMHPTPSMKHCDMFVYKQQICLCQENRRGPNLVHVLSQVMAAAVTLMEEHCCKQQNGSIELTGNPDTSVLHHLFTTYLLATSMLGVNVGCNSKLP